MLGLVRDKRYFVLHAPRQTGKTSALLALRDLLNARSEYRCVYVTVEAGQAARENVADAMRAVLFQLESEEQATLGSDTLAGIWPRALERAGALGAFRASLAGWCMADPRPLVLLLDEIDTLVGDTLLSVLRQLRAGYPDRPGRFPHSVVLCGVRDVRDYRIYSTARNAVVLGGSAFNIKSKSLRLGGFQRSGDAGAAGPAHGPDRAGVHRRRGGRGLDAHGGPAVAGECVVSGGVLREPRGPGPFPRDHGRRHPRRPGAADHGPHKALERTIEEGLAQTRGYMERCGAEAGHLIVFDRAPDRTWREKIFRREASTAAGAVTVWGM